MVLQQAARPFVTFPEASLLLPVVSAPKVN